MLNALMRADIARRYFYATVVAALIPLITVAALYDRYYKQLIDTVFESRVEGDLGSAAARMNSFIAGQINRLENIVDIPDTASFFKERPAQIGVQLFDFLLLEAESADVYSIELLDLDDSVIAAVPAVGTVSAKPSTTTPFVLHGGAEIIGPVLPDEARPGWFMIRMPVLVNQEKLGSVALRMRLASLTEQMAPLSGPGIFSPQLTVFERLRVGATGTSATPARLIQRSQQILPGWHIDLVSTGQSLSDPLQRLRAVLFVVSVILAVSLSALFLQMSRRLSSYLSPLKEGAEAVSHGDFSTEVPENAPGELGSLARAFNAMRRQLRNMINSRVEIERRAALGNLAAGIAHEIRNPLATINTAVYGLKTGERDPERLEMYEEVSDEIARVDQTIDEFLNYARPSPPQQVNIRVRDVFQSLRRLTTAQLLEHGVTLNLTGESGLCLFVDPAHLRQILLNLILNSLDALPDGGTITLRVYRDGDSTVLDVMDNGVGMDAETRANILQPFFTTRAGGTGLGLPVTVELVRSNGGVLSVESALGSGTRVTLTFKTKGQDV